MKNKVVTTNEDKSHLESVKETLINYLLMKVTEEDWHAVADAAMDLREIEIRLKK